MRIGRYETSGVIGTGGMGTVYKARALAAGGFEREVALKVMHNHLLSDQQFVEMFLAEARLAARILHPNVVATHDVQQLPNGLFLVMDFVPGPSLHTVLEVMRRREEYLPIGMCLSVFLDALAGLHAAHELKDAEGNALNIVHRDISPDNILISRDGNSRLTDFGLARAQAQIGSTRGGQVKGKLAFLPPEAVMLGQIDRRTDVYGVGATLWEAMTSQRLFRADNEGMLLALVIEGAQRTPRYENPKVPEPISEVCMQALHKNPELRFQTADELGAALRDAARASGVEIMPASEIAQWLAPMIESEDLLKLVPERPSTRPFPSLSEEQVPTHGGTAVTSPGTTSRRVPLFAAIGLTVVCGVAFGGYLASVTKPDVAPPNAADPNAAQLAPPVPTAEAAAVVPPTPSATTSAKPAPVDAGAEPAPPTEPPTTTPAARPRAPLPAPRPQPQPRPRRPPRSFDPDTL